MNIVKIRNLEIGEGKPKIVVPIVGTTKDEIINEASNLKLELFDMVEWRVDYFEHAFETNKIEEILIKLREILLNIPILFTFRTDKEGGEKEIDIEKYELINKHVLNKKLIDIIDIELFMGNEVVSELVKLAHNNNINVLISNHDFEKTPTCEEIISRFKAMDDLGADILKIAVMPKNKLDVLELIKATTIMQDSNIGKPIVSISMSRLGMMSRFCGEIFGSALTFGSTGKLSAPGQINVEDLNNLMEIIHKNLK